MPSGLEHLQEAHIVERIGEQAADQEFERKVIDPLAPRIVAFLLRGQPAMHDPVAQRQRRSLVPIVLGRHAGVLADRETKLGEDRALDLRDREFISCVRAEAMRMHFPRVTGGPCTIVNVPYSFTPEN